MVNSIKMSWMTLGICFSLSGCSDQTQFSGNPSAAASADAVSKGRDDADNNIRTSPSGTTTIEVPDSSDNTVTAAQTADSLDDPGSVLASPTNPGGQAAADRLKLVCGQGPKKTLTQQIRFPETANCRFGQAGNLDRRDRHLQAVEAQISSIALPSNAQLCGVSIDSQVGTIQYDDFMILTLNGYVLLSSNAGILQGLEGNSATAYKWDFSRIRGMTVDFNSAPYCMGGSTGVCQVPVTDTPGKFQFQVNPTNLIHLADQVVNNHALNFALLATGDNDDQDCWHTDLNMSFTLQYVEAP